MLRTNSIRTTDELKDPLFNYFIAFKINLKETDKAKIEPLVKKVLSDPKGSVHSRRLLELKTDIMEIMCDDSTYDTTNGTYKKNSGGRAKEAAEAKKLKLRETLDIVQILCKTRTTLLKSEIKNIYDSANKPVIFFTEEEFNDAIRPLLSVGIKIIDNIDASIPFDKYSKTEDLLKVLGKKDLYDFLGCSVSTSLIELEVNNEEQYKNSQKINDLKKKQAICGLCNVVKELLLSSPQARKNYNDYLALKDDVWADFIKRHNFGIKEITTSEYDIYVNIIISKMQISKSEADKLLTIGCKFFGFRITKDYEEIIVEENKETNDYIYCPYCGKKLNK